MKQAPGVFSKRVIELALSIPAGRVTTYGLLAVAAGGHPILAQMVTSILWKSAEREKVPWHRIVYSSGKIWMDPRVDKLRKKLYKTEGINLDKNNKIIDFEKIIYTF
jgi:methylated-DNA-protein-cysteine methyltransferase-like protein